MSGQRTKNGRKPRFTPYLYAAYGMNTSMAGMMGRCPFAKAAGTMVLKDHALVFRGVADVIAAPGRQVVLALWKITPVCENALDRLEGYRPGGGLYDKRYIEVHGRGPLAGKRAMIYVMTRKSAPHQPYAGYESMLREGYEDFGMPQSQIDRAKEEARSTEAPRWMSRYFSDDAFETGSKS
jgi:hypothetical protein